MRRAAEPRSEGEGTSFVIVKRSMVLASYERDETVRET